MPGLPGSGSQMYFRYRDPSAPGIFLIQELSGYHSGIGQFRDMFAAYKFHRLYRVSTLLFRISGSTFFSINSTRSKILGLNVPVTPTEIFCSALAYITFPPSPIAA